MQSPRTQGGIMLRAQARALFGAGLMIILVGCADTTGPSMPRVGEHSRMALGGFRVTEALQRALLDTLARQTALALANPNVRAAVYRAIGESPYREGKLPMS